MVTHSSVVVVCIVLLTQSLRLDFVTTKILATTQVSTALQEVPNRQGHRLISLFIDTHSLTQLLIGSYDRLWLNVPNLFGVLLDTAVGTKLAHARRAHDTATRPLLLITVSLVHFVLRFQVRLKVG